MIVPAGAEGLDPFQTAEDIELSQEIAGAPEGFAPGVGLRRSVTAESRGAALVRSCTPGTRSPIVAGLATSASGWARPGRHGRPGGYALFQGRARHPPDIVPEGRPSERGRAAPAFPK